MKILIADDHPMVLSSISSVLEDNGHSVTTAASFYELQALFKQGTQNSWDILLLDYHFPEGKITDLLEQSSLPSNAIIAILSGMTDPEDILFVLETAQADLFIPKTIDMNDLVSVIPQLKLKKEKKPLIWSLEHRKLSSIAEQFPKGTVLTPKEREVFMLLRKGMLDKQIADKLNRSIHTIRVQIRSIKRKRPLSRRSEL